MLQADPSLSPDDVKCRLMASARPAVTADGRPAYSILQQGTGLVNAYDAVYGSAAYLPMSDGAEYRIWLSQSGLVARPLNAEADGAVRTWR